MKIFISWSGPLSRYIAETLRDWLPSVLQTVEPYVSSEDIYKGARWSVDVSRELEFANYGILCVTASNINAPWLNFEAGALSKTFEEGRVSPFLFDIKASNVTGPLLQFQSTVYERDDVFKLMKSINVVTEVPLEEVRLYRVFEVWWPELYGKLEQAKDLFSAEKQPKKMNRSVEEMVAELLDLARVEQKALYDLSQRVPRPSTSAAEMEALQGLVEELVLQGRLTSKEVVDALPNHPLSRKFRNWLTRLLNEVEPRANDPLPTETLSTDSKSPDDL